MNKKILKQGYKQLDNMLTYYSKVTVVFLQLHQTEFTPDNGVISLFLKQLKRRLEKHYNCTVAYLWVREQGGAPAQHYHLVVMVNGHKCSSSQYILKVATEIWESQKGGNYSFKVKNRIYRIETYKNNNEYQAARMRMSYLAKMKTKDTSRPYLNSFGVSRVAPNPLTNKNT
ncbi:YagK/YfjJ domain-containing protein [Photobacterium damselae]|uniref:YagK/YfjJ domain-containing protein n=1 Tax=Photobacterium damselae TaxID=38293 RepID=UPI0025439ECC